MAAHQAGERLGGAERRELRRQAHALHPVVHLGGAGVTDALIGAVDRALEDHELIKLRLVGERDERQQVAEEVASRTGSELAGLVGRVAILYRPASDPERRRIDPRLRSAR
jgi:RNA-binding protein